MIKNKIYSSGQIVTLAVSETYTLKADEVMINNSIYRKIDLEISIQNNSETSAVNTIHIAIRKRKGRINLPAVAIKHQEWEINGVPQTSLSECIENITVALAISSGLFPIPESEISVIYTLKQPLKETPWTNAVLKLERFPTISEAFVFFDESGNISLNSLISTTSNTSPDEPNVTLGTWVNGEAAFAEWIGITPDNIVDLDKFSENTVISKKPKFINNGLIIEVEGSPTLDFMTSQRFLTANTNLDIDNGESFTVITVSTNNVVGSGCVCSTGTTGIEGANFLNDRRTNKLHTFVNATVNGFGNYLLQQDSGSQKILTTTFDNFNVVPYLNKEMQTAAVWSGDYQNNGFIIGSQDQTGVTSPLNGTIQEIIVLKGDQTDNLNALNDWVLSRYTNPPVNKSNMFVLLGGQSNALGNTGGVAPTRPELIGDIPNSFINQGNQYKQLNYPSNNQGSNFASELSFCEKFVTNTGEYVFIDKYAVGGAAISVDTIPDFNITSNQLLINLKASLSRLKNVSITNNNGDAKFVLFWIQGERDAGLGKGDEYEANFNAILAELNAIQQLDFVVMNILNDGIYQAGTTPPITTPNLAEVTSAQVSLVSSIPYMESINMNNFTLGNDFLHFTSAAQENIGDELWNMLKIKFSL